MILQDCHVWVNALMQYAKQSVLWSDPCSPDSDDFSSCNPVSALH